MRVLASQLLGFGPDARVLLVNADDLGMRPSITAAVFEAIDHGIVRSTSLMTVCPGSVHAVARLRGRPRAAGRPVVDHPFLDSFSLDVDHKAERYASLLRALPAGLTEWAVHPGADDGPTHDARVRRSDLAFLTSDRAREIVAEEGIELIDYRPLQRHR